MSRFRDQQFLTTGMASVDEVFSSKAAGGPGIARGGAYVLVGVDLGVGKTTLALQIAGEVSKQVPVLFVYYGHEQDLGLLSQRLGVASKNIIRMHSPDIEDVVARAEELRAGLVVVDDLRTASRFLHRQVQTVFNALLFFTKARDAALIALTYFNKSGEFSTAVEYACDAILVLEKFQSATVLSAPSKHRFARLNAARARLSLGEKGFTEVRG